MSKFSLITVYISDWSAELRQQARLLLAGGRWSTQLPVRVRRSLRWFLADGLFANASGTIIRTYQAIYLLALGATRGQIGMFSSLTNLMMPLAMLPGARLARRSDKKRVVVISSLIGRLLLLVLILLPALAGRAAVGWSMGVLVVYAFLMNLLNPAWTTLVGQIVPAQWRGRYFSSRNILMGLVSFLAVLGMGQIVDRFVTPVGYQIVFGMAVALGLGATYTFAQIEVPATTSPPAKQADGAVFWSRLRTQRSFLALCGTAAIWNLGVQVASPFFTVYLVDAIQASATAVAVVAAISSLAALPGQRVFGPLNDRHGPRWVQQMTALAIPFVPAIWVLMTRPWQAYIVEAFSAFAWAGYNLAAFNLLLEMTPNEGRSSFVAFYQTLAGLGMVGGAAIGGWIAETQGYLPVFLLSAGLRMLGALVFAFVVARVLPIPKLRSLRTRETRRQKTRRQGDKEREQDRHR